MKPINVFPRRIYARQMPGWVDSPNLAKTVWLRIKTGLIWYAVDYEILSPTSIRLFVYDMADSCHGGIGKQIYTTVVTDLEPAEQAMLDAVVLQIYHDAAERVINERAAAKYEKEISKVRKELFGV